MTNTGGSCELQTAQDRVGSREKTIVYSGGLTAEARTSKAGNWGRIGEDAAQAQEDRKGEKKLKNHKK